MKTMGGWILGLGLFVYGGCDSGKVETSAPLEGSASASTGAKATASAAKSAAEPAVKPVASHVPKAVDGANITMGSTEVDGFKAKDLSCKSGGGMFASMAIVGTLAKQKEALDKCVSGPESVAVHFAYEGGKTTDVRIAGASAAKVARCVADVLTAIKLPDKGACVMTIELGAT